MLIVHFRPYFSLMTRFLDQWMGLLALNSQTSILMTTLDSLYLCIPQMIWHLLGEKPQGFLAYQKLLKEMNKWVNLSRVNKPRSSSVDPSLINKLNLWLTKSGSTIASEINKQQSSPPNTFTKGVRMPRFGHRVRVDQNFHIVLIQSSKWTLRESFVTLTGFLIRIVGKSKPAIQITVSSRKRICTGHHATLRARKIKKECSSPNSEM